MSDHKQNSMEGIPQEAIDLREQAIHGHADEMKSMRLLREAVSVSPDFFDAHSDFARVALSYCRDNHAEIEQSQIDEIVKEIGRSLDKCIDLRPGLAPLYARRACISYLSGDYQRGMEHADKALGIDDGNFEANLYKGCNYLGLADKERRAEDNARNTRELADQAIGPLSEARSVDPDSFEAVYSLASAHECVGHAAYDLGDKEESRRSFRQALELCEQSVGLAAGREGYSGQMAFANLDCGRLKWILVETFGERYSNTVWRSMYVDVIGYTTAAIERKPDFAEAYKLRANANLCLQQLTDSRADALRAQQYADDPEIQELLKWLEMCINARASARADHAARQAGQAEARA